MPMFKPVKFKDIDFKSGNLDPRTDLPHQTLEHLLKRLLKTAELSIYLFSLVIGVIIGRTQFDFVSFDISSSWIVKFAIFLICASWVTMSLFFVLKYFWEKDLKMGAPSLLVTVQFSVSLLLGLLWTVMFIGTFAISIKNQENLSNNYAELVGVSICSFLVASAYIVQMVCSWKLLHVKNNLEYENLGLSTSLSGSGNTLDSIRERNKKEKERISLYGSPTQKNAARASFSGRPSLVGGRSSLVGGLNSKKFGSSEKLAKRSATN